MVFKVILGSIFSDLIVFKAITNVGLMMGSIIVYMDWFQIKFTSWSMGTSDWIFSNQIQYEWIKIMMLVV